MGQPYPDLQAARVLGPLGLSERAKTALRAYVQQQRRALAKRNDARAAVLLRLKLQPRLRPEKP